MKNILLSASAFLMILSLKSCSNDDSAAAAPVKNNYLEVKVNGNKKVFSNVKGRWVDGGNYLELTATDNGQVVAYTRLLPPGISYKEPSIGRVVVSPSHRAFGLGRELMQRSMDESYRRFGKSTIRISAQLYLKHFYSSLGFEPVSDVYDEDGIPHIEMVKNG